MIGETKERLMVSVVSEKMDDIIKNSFVKPMDFIGRPMKEFVFVSEKRYDIQEKLEQWVELEMNMQ